MKVFLSYASEDRDEAERVALALAGARFEVFFDDQRLAASDDYLGRISTAIDGCELFIFLITSSSVAEGKFTLSELRLVRKKWPHPAGRVLAVNLRGIPLVQIPNYLRASTLLPIQGNAAAEVRAAAEHLRSSLRRRSFTGISMRLALVAALAMSAAAIGFLVRSPSEDTQPSGVEAGATGWIYVGSRIDGEWRESAADGIEPKLTLDVANLPVKGANYTLIHDVHLRESLPNQAGNRSRPPMPPSKGALGAGSVLKVDDVSSIEIAETEARVWVWAHVTVVKVE